jgi:hypothetical protein
MHDTPSPGDSLARNQPRYWLHLRRHLARDPEGARQALEGLVFSESKGASSWGDPPDRRPKHEAAVLHGDAEATRRLAIEEMEQCKRPSHGSIILFYSLTDPEVALRFAKAQPLNFATAAGPFAFQVVDNLGAKAAPVLVALLERVSSGPDTRQALAQAAVLADAAYCRLQVERIAREFQAVLRKALG